MELADLFLVNKADGELAAAAARAAAEYRGALQFLRPASPRWHPPVLQCSALTGQGIPEVWETVCRYRETMDESGEIAARRAGQACAWMWSEVGESLMAALRAHPAVAEALPELEAGVRAGRVPATAAARRLLRAFRKAGSGAAD
jgi:LAO/AO transport system kinase